MTETQTDLAWNPLLRDQVEWHWTNQLRDRLAGLSDDEYFWEPVASCWSGRPRGTSDAPVQAGTGAMTIDFAMPEPDPSPFECAAWKAGVEALGEDGLRRPCGPAEGQFAEEPLAALVLHINRELLHHLSEVCLLRDLFLHSHRADTHRSTSPEAS